MDEYIERESAREILSEMTNEMNSEIGINRDGISMEYCRGYICALQDASAIMEEMPPPTFAPKDTGSGYIITIYME